MRERTSQGAGCLEDSFKEGMRMRANMLRGQEDGDWNS